jgi:hypothetical protein
MVLGVTFSIRRFGSTDLFFLIVVIVVVVVVVVDDENGTKTDHE